jgi:hypothetical protein
MYMPSSASKATASAGTKLTVNEIAAKWDNLPQLDYSGAEFIHVGTIRSPALDRIGLPAR